MVQCNSGQIFSWSFNTSLKCFISSVSFTISLFREVFSCSRDSYSWKERKKKNKSLLIVKTFFSVLPPWVYSCNCRKAWFLIATCKMQTKDRHGLGAGTERVLHDLCPDHAVILFAALKTRRCRWPSEVPSSPGLQVWVAVSPWWPLPASGPPLLGRADPALHCQSRENESTECR